MTIKWSKLSNELAINWSRTYVRRTKCVCRCDVREFVICVRELSARRHSSSEAAARQWLLPPPFYFICFAATAQQRRRRWWRRKCGWYFSQSRVPSTVISTKIRQRLAIVPVSAALLHWLPHIVRQFFSPRHIPDYASPPTLRRYVRHDFYALTRVTANKVQPVDLRSMNDS